MFIIKIANLNFKINNNFPFLEHLCKNYITEETHIDGEIFVSQNEIDEEIKNSNLNYSKGYIEAICCYRKICLMLPKFDAFLLHAASVKIDNNGYAFLAKSGTGKTTHILLLKKLLQDKLIYINGDKPIIRIINGLPVIFGTPWCGKENLENNTSAILKSLCFIERDLTNSIEKLDKTEVIKKLIHQVLLPNDEQMITKTFELLNHTILTTNVYLLRCNTDISSAVLSYNTIKQ